MVPAAFMGIEAIPMTPSGKADRKALPDPELTAVGAYTPPQTGTEKALCVIFAEVLGWSGAASTTISSPRAGTAFWPCRSWPEPEAKGSDLAVRDIFKSPDVAGLATRIESRRTVKDQLPAVWTFPGTGAEETVSRLKHLYSDWRPSLPLTPLQQGILFHSLESEGAYQVQVRFRVEGNFDPERFHAAWQQAVDRHEALRMAIPEGIRPSWSSTAGLTPLPVRRLE